MNKTQIAHKALTSIAALSDTLKELTSSGDVEVVPLKVAGFMGATRIARKALSDMESVPDESFPIPDSLLDRIIEKTCPPNSNWETDQKNEHYRNTRELLKSPKSGNLEFLISKLLA